MFPSSPYILLDDARSLDADCLLFQDPIEVIICNDPAKVEDSLAALREAQAQGLYLAGFLAYELGYMLEPKLRRLLPEGRRVPLIWMGVFRDPEHLTSAEVGALLEDAGEARMQGFAPTVSRTSYLDAVSRVRDAIAAGDVYQINYTVPTGFQIVGDPVALYARLRRRQRGGYGALLAFEDRYVLSLSPELFVEVEDGMVRVRPMKGTAPRGASPEDDAARARALQIDPKSRAENLMIVDLLRNDLGRVAEIGSVEVTDLFSVEAYPTLYQMTSGITARLRPDVDFPELLRAIFPCGSVTGAPKIRAMEIIRDLELHPRGIYTGAIGYAAPGGAARFSVAIRTITVDGDGMGEMGIGSGIVYDSDAEAEYEECLLKARFLTEEEEPFQLLETLAWRPGEGYLLLDRHLERLSGAAARFGYACNIDAVRRELEQAADGLNGPHRVRLLVDAGGRCTLTTAPLEPIPDVTFALSDKGPDRRSPFTYHKTTRREVYERERRNCGTDEVVFVNERGELTEGSFTNLFIERNGLLLTPPLGSGLLPGTLRADLLASGRAKESALTPTDLETADAVWLGNSVRGLMRARRQR